MGRLSTRVALSHLSLKGEGTKDVTECLGCQSETVTRPPVHYILSRISWRSFRDGLCAGKKLLSQAATHQPPQCGSSNYPQSQKTMKRKHDSDALLANASPKPSKKTHFSVAPKTSTKIHSCFRPDLFEPQTLTSYQSAYQRSKPYRHGVIASLVSDELLRSVRNEIFTHISFTPKETDIYKIQQSGDLANLDGLESAQLAHLPNMVRLRDALYSADFRTFLEEVTGAGRLSGKKTDMAVNIYTPGSYLLCHDDVIGSRRVSYILYLTDPDEPWEADWGGGLRLYATEIKINAKGKKVKVPMSEHAKVIPPSWGQLSFFAVQPGESFHDVEEVYFPRSGAKEDGNKRVRMAISGWYHIPQDGEEGYEEGVEQKLAERSSLSQLQGKEADEFEQPRPRFVRFDKADQNHSSQSLEASKDAAVEVAIDDEPALLSESDLDFLLQYISPSYLTPEMADQLSSSFEEDSVLQLDRFLCDKFATALKDFVLAQNGIDPSEDFNDSQRQLWQTARPPHKHRFLFQQGPPASLDRVLKSTLPNDSPTLPMSALLTDLCPSTPFRKWLSIITGLKVDGDACLDILARRFRKGKDYALASAHEGEKPRLEFCFGATPTGSWGNGLLDDVGGNEGDAHADDDGAVGAAADLEAGKETKSHRAVKTEEAHSNQDGQTQHGKDFGGQEIYLAADDDDDDNVNDDNTNDNNENALTQPVITTTTTNTTDQPPPPYKNKNKPKSDPAIYRSANAEHEGEEEEDAILFTDPPTWNRLSIVLRDKGTLRFVKYISAAAEGDRWDVKGVIVPGERGWDEEDEDGEEEGEGEGSRGTGGRGVGNGEHEGSEDSVESEASTEEEVEVEEEEEEEEEDDSDET